MMVSYNRDALMCSGYDQDAIAENDLNAPSNATSSITTVYVRLSPLISANVIRKDAVKETRPVLVS